MIQLVCKAFDPHHHNTIALLSRGCILDGVVHKHVVLSINVPDPVQDTLHRLGLALLRLELTVPQSPFIDKLPDSGDKRQVGVSTGMYTPVDIGLDVLG